jgi:hypothetical protein
MTQSRRRCPGASGDAWCGRGDGLEPWQVSSRGRSRRLRHWDAIIVCGIPLLKATPMTDVTPTFPYTGKAFVRGGSAPYESGEISGLYQAGAVRNIITFHQNIIGGEFSNPTVEPSVNSTLATILGREAARRRKRLSMEELIREDRRIEADLTGLDA